MLDGIQYICLIYEKDSTKDGIGDLCKEVKAFFLP